MERTTREMVPRPPQPISSSPPDTVDTLRYHRTKAAADAQPSLPFALPTPELSSPAPLLFDTDVTFTPPTSPRDTPAVLLKPHSDVWSVHGTKPTFMAPEERLEFVSSGLRQSGVLNSGVQHFDPASDEGLQPVNLCFSTAIPHWTVTKGMEEEESVHDPLVLPSSAHRMEDEDDSLDALKSLLQSVMSGQGEELVTEEPQSPAQATAPWDGLRTFTDRVSPFSAFSTSHWSSGHGAFFSSM